MIFPADVLLTMFGLEAAELPVPLTGGRVGRLWRCGDWVVKVFGSRPAAGRALPLQELAAAAGLPVPAPRRTKSGALWAEVDGGPVAVMPFLPGTRRERGSLTLDEAANLGRALRRLHAVLASCPVDQPPRIPEPAVRWARLKEQALAVPTPAEFDRLVVEIADYICGAVQRLPAANWAGLPWQLCHGDPHPDNFLFDERGEVVGVLDFDNAAPSWPGMEAMMAWNLCFCSDPGEPSLTPAGARFFQAYGADERAWLLRYWYVLAGNTWPASLRYRGAAIAPEWTEILLMRYRAARRFEEW